MNEAYKNIIDRRSVRNFNDIKVSHDVIEKIVYAGQCAPSGMNRQIFAFVVVENEELIEKLGWIQNFKCETPTLEIKSAERGCPKHLYDSLSSFSNQDDGGIIIFGIDEKQNFKEVGVYDPQDIQKKINEQCRQMEPVIRPQITVVEKNDKYFVSAEIPAADISDRPVFYRGRGRVKGSFVRVGDSDEPMTEYEVYSYEAYRKNIKMISE